MRYDSDDGYVYRVNHPISLKAMSNHDESPIGIMIIIVIHPK